MPIGSIKNSESKDKAKLKVRLVFRGDDTRDENNQLALFRELKSIPASIATVNLVLWFGLRQGNMVQIADAKKAYLQAPIRSSIPTYVVLPREAWKPQWHRRFRRVAARVRKAMYGHPTSGDDWTLYLDEVVVCRLQGDRVEGWPSL
jgi:CHASE1-domain containing sensor protein